MLPPLTCKLNAVVALWLSYLQESFENGLLHVPLAIFGLLQDELVQVVLQKRAYSHTHTSPTKWNGNRVDGCYLEVVGHSGAAVAVVHAEVRQLGILFQVREGRASEIKKST